MHFLSPRLAHVLVPHSRHVTWVGATALQHVKTKRARRTRLWQPAHALEVAHGPCLLEDVAERRARRGRRPAACAG